MYKKMLYLVLCIITTSLIIFSGCQVYTYENENVSISKSNDIDIKQKTLSESNVPSDAFTTVALYPTKDTRIFSIYPGSTGNKVSYYAADRWTWGGVFGTVRSVMEFDLSSIPDFDDSSNNYITDATLYLYHHPDIGHSGDNRSFITHVTGSWDVNTITWNSLPAISARSYEMINTSTSTTQDYTVNLGNMLYIYHRYFGSEYNRKFRLMINLVPAYENSVTTRARMYFASSDYPNAAYRPKLVVTYKIKPLVVYIVGASTVQANTPNTWDAGAYNISGTVSYKWTLKSLDMGVNFTTSTSSSVTWSIPHIGYNPGRWQIILEVTDSDETVTTIKEVYAYF